MFGPPQDVAGECNAHLHIGDDYGDNHATMRCQLPEGHEGRHQEKYDHNGGEVIVTWDGNDRDEGEGEEHLELQKEYEELRQEYEKHLKHIPTGLD